MSSSYHPETDGQTERINCTLEQVLRHYVSPTQHDWGRHPPLVEFALNNAKQESTHASPFLLVYGQHPLTPVSIGIDTAVPAAETFTVDIHDRIEHTRALLHAVQSRQKVYADRRRRELEYSPGDLVLLNSKHIAMRKRIPKAARKLMPRFLGPFRVVERIGKVAYRLDLPATMRRVHPVFHVSLLKLYQHNSSRPFTPTPIIWAEDPEPENPLYEIDHILAHRERSRRGKSTYEFLIKWTGLGPEHNEWVSEAACTPFAVEQYWRSLRIAAFPAFASFPDAPAGTARR